MYVCFGPVCSEIFYLCRFENMPVIRYVLLWKYVCVPELQVLSSPSYYLLLFIMKVETMLVSFVSIISSPLAFDQIVFL